VKLGERVQAHLLLMTMRARGLEQGPDKHEGDQAQESDDNKP
jgi:hypothetical protein